SEDWQLYRRVRLAALEEAPYAFGSTYAAERDLPERRWRQTLIDRTRFVAEYARVVRGTVSGGDGESVGVGAMTAVWVDPRSRRRGVGGGKCVVHGVRAVGRPGLEEPMRKSVVEARLRRVGDDRGRASFGHGGKSGPHEQVADVEQRRIRVRRNSRVTVRRGQLVLE